MKKVEMFQADDGRTFETEEAALWHEERTAWERWYEKNGIWTGGDECVDCDELIRWVHAHKGEMRALISLLSSEPEGYKR